MAGAADEGCARISAFADLRISAEAMTTSLLIALVDASAADACAAATGAAATAAPANTGG
jgi:hypothetical protein